jgi:hypothetical protein
MMRRIPQTIERTDTVVCRIACAAVCQILRAAAVMAALCALDAAVMPGVVAQTLTSPNAGAAPSQPPVTSKPQPAAHLKSCSKYGAGFVAMPGTDACIKIGGGVTAEFGR